MAANFQPVFVLTPNIGKTTFGSTALTKSDGSAVTGIGTDIFLLFSAGANGSFVERVRISPVAIVAATATTATVHRLYISTVNTGNPTNVNTALIQEIGAAAQTADHSTNATFFFDVPLNIKMPSGTYLLVSTHVVNAANTNWEAVCFAMDF